MNTRTRYFVVASLLVLTVGLGTGLVAYYVGFPTSAFSPEAGPAELKFIPKDVSLVAFADVHEVMASDIRQKLLPILPDQGDGQREFQEHTGINIETDIDRVVACLTPSAQAPAAGMVLARGRFDEVKIEALMRQHGAAVEDYKGRRLILAPVGDSAQAGDTAQPQMHPGPMSLAFVESGLIALGSTELIRQAIDRRDGGDSIMADAQMMDLIGEIDDGHVWAAGRFDVLQAQARLPQEVTSQLPPITWFTAKGHLNGGIRAVLRAETTTEESATSLRDVARGFLALARLQAGSYPDLKGALDTIELSGTGKTVALSFDIPAAVFDALTAIPRPAPVR
jgi:hypothetical protein